MILSGPVIKNDPKEYFRNIYESPPSDWTSMGNISYYKSNI